MAKKIDILLINAITRKQIPAFVPNGLLWVATVLKQKGFSVVLYDRNCDSRSIEEVLKQYNPKIVGVSVLTGEVILDGINISKFIRDNYKDSKIIWGGLHPTLFPNYVLAEEYVDYIVMGEGEYPMLELAENLLEGKHNLKDIKNIGYKTDEGIKINLLRPFVNMDELPFPDFSLLDISKYFLLRPYAKKTLCLMTSRGCPFNCTFCYNKKVNMGKWRGMSALRLIEMIKLIKKEYDIDGFLFHDDNFDANAQRLKEFCDILIEEKIKIKWEHCSRVNYATEERLKLEKKAGCEMIAYGLESGSERILKLIKKGQTVPQIEKAINLCKKTGISTGVGSIIGYPFENENDLNETLALFKRVEPTHIFATIYNPYPGSDLYDYVIKEGLFKEPPTLEGQGKIYTVDNLELNMSSISKKILQEIIYKYLTRNLINEVKDYLRFGNFFGLYIAAKNYLLRPGAVSRILGSYKDSFIGFLRRIKIFSQNKNTENFSI